MTLPILQMRKVGYWEQKALTWKKWAWDPGPSESKAQVPQEELVKQPDGREKEREGHRGETGGGHRSRCEHQERNPDNQDATRRSL